MNDKKYLLRSNRNGYHSYLTRVEHDSVFGGGKYYVDGFFGERNKYHALRLTKQEAVEAWNRFEPTYLEVVDAP